MLMGTQAVHAQDDEKQDKKFFRKENLFTGGSVSASMFSRYSLLLGANPVFGYSLTNWADLGLVANYTYTSDREYDETGALYSNQKQNVYGGGIFTRLFPVHFLFAQAQVEHNWIQYKYREPANEYEYRNRVSANSVLVGGGFTTGRSRIGKGSYGYFAILWDVSNDLYSPYKDGNHDATPIIRAGVNIPLFQGKRY